MNVWDFWRLEVLQFDLPLSMLDKILSVVVIQCTTAGLPNILPTYVDNRGAVRKKRLLSPNSDRHLTATRLEIRTLHGRGAKNLSINGHRSPSVPLAPAGGYRAQC
jgi:hypothetical protein